MMKTYSVKKHKNDLSIPYKALYQTLWQFKKQRSQAESKNSFLKAKLNQKQKIILKPKKKTQIQSNTNYNFNDKKNILNHPVIQQQKSKHTKLNEKISFIENWIKNTNKQIQQKNYEKLVNQTKKIQNKLIAMSKKAKRAQRIYTKYINKQQQIQNFQNSNIQNYQNQLNEQGHIKQEDNIQYLESLKNQLESQNKELFQNLQLQQRQVQSLRKDMITLLKQKNQLRKLLGNTKSKIAIH